MNYIENLKLVNAQAVTPKVNTSPVSVPQVKTQEQKAVNDISNVTPDFQVFAPMSYSYMEDLKISDDLTGKCYKLANGQKIVIVPKDGTTVVKTYVNTGSMNEPDSIRGISHYIEHNLFNGSEALGDKVFFDEVNKMGANTNASTSFSVTDYYVSSNLLDDTDLENKIKLHAGMIQSPKFLLEKLEKEKNIVNSEINMCLSNDENIGFTQTVKNLFNVNSSSMDLVAGSTDNISALTRDDVVNYFNNNYYPANMTTVITGEVEPEETMKLVSKYFTSKKPPVQNRHFEQMTPIEKTVRQDIISTKSEGGASIFLGFAGPENNNTKDKVQFEALTALLIDLANSKFSSLERKYSTGIGVFTERLSSRPNDKTMAMIETEVKDDYVEIFLKDLYSKIAKVSNNPPSEDELKAIKSSMKIARQQWLECSHALNNSIGQSLLDKRPEYMNEYNNIVDALTPQDISDIAKKYLDLNKVALTVVHPSHSSVDKINNNYNAAKDISFTGAKKKTPIKLDKVSEYKLENNYDIILNETNADVVNFKFSLYSNIDAPQKAAAADVLNEMLKYGGTQKRNLAQLSAKFDSLGASTGIDAAQRGITLSSTFPADNAEDILALFKEKIQTPDLSQKNFEQAIKRCADMYSTHEVSPYDKFDKAIYKNTPLSITVDDKKESLASITLDDVKTLYKDLMNNSQGQIVVSGGFAKNPELKDTIFNSIAKYNNVQSKEIVTRDSFIPHRAPELYTDVHKKNQAQILEGFKFKFNKNLKDTVSLQLLNEILGGSPSSRLFSDLREQRHLAYSVFSDFDHVDDIGVITLSIGTTTENHETGEKTFDNIQKSIEGFNDNINKLQMEKVSAEELEAAKKALKTMILSPLEMNSAKTSVLSDISRNPYGLSYINKKLEMIDKITADDILTTARNVFSTSPVYSITATQASLDANKSYLEVLTKIRSD